MPAVDVTFFDPNTAVLFDIIVNVLQLTFRKIFTKTWIYLVLNFRMTVEVPLNVRRQLMYTSFVICFNDPSHKFNNHLSTLMQ